MRGDEYIDKKVKVSNVLKFRIWPILTHIRYNTMIGAKVIYHNYVWFVNTMAAHVLLERSLVVKLSIRMYCLTLR